MEPAVYELLQAVRDRDTIRIKQLAGAEPCPVNTVIDDSGQTLLHLLARSADVAGIEALVEVGGDVCARDRYGAEVIDILFDAMFGVNHVFHAVPKTCPIIRDCLLPHVSELYQAIWMCSTDEVERLLSIGSDPSEERPNGKSPLFWAISLNDLSSIRLLLASGADPNHIEHFNWTPLTTALVTARGDIIQFLLHSGADPNKRTRAGVPPILYAGIAGQHADDPLWAIKALIHYGADPCAGDANGHTALHDVGNPQFVEFFLRQGCDVNATTANGRTPLHEAARASMTEGAQVLLAAGANPNAQDDAGTTPLHIAVYEIIDTEYVGFCQLLLDRGADIDCPDGAGRTPRMLMKELEQVASECDPEVLEFFHKYIQV